MEYGLVKMVQKATPAGHSNTANYIMGMLLFGAAYFLWDLYKCR